MQALERPFAVPALRGRAAVLVPPFADVRRFQVREVLAHDDGKLVFQVVPSASAEPIEALRRVRAGELKGAGGFGAIELKPSGALEHTEPERGKAGERRDFIGGHGEVCFFRHLQPALHDTGIIGVSSHEADAVFGDRGARLIERVADDPRVGGRLNGSIPLRPHGAYDVLTGEVAWVFVDNEDGKPVIGHSTAWLRACGLDTARSWRERLGRVGVGAVELSLDRSGHIAQPLGQSEDFLELPLHGEARAFAAADDHDDDELTVNPTHHVGAFIVVSAGAVQESHCSVAERVSGDVKGTPNVLCHVARVNEW